MTQEIQKNIKFLSELLQNKQEKFVNELKNKLSDQQLNLLDLEIKDQKSDIYSVLITIFKTKKAWSEAKPKDRQPFISEPLFLIIKDQCSAWQEKELIDLYIGKGREKINADLGITNYDERSQKQLEASMQTRFGMVVAAQMVAGSSNSDHGKMMKVHQSLLKSDDSAEVDNAISKALSSITQSDANNKNQSLLNPRKNDHTFAYGGDSSNVSVLELKVIDNILENKDEYNVDFSVEDIDSLKKYKDSVNRGKNIGYMAIDYRASGAYRSKNGITSRIKDEEKAIKKAKEFEAKLNLAGKTLQQSCLNLKNGESLTIESGLDEHAMQVVIRKIDEEYKLTTYDSSGALERSALTEWRLPSFLGGGRLPNPFGAIALLLKGGENAVTKNGYSLLAPAANLESTEGLKYLKTLLRSNTTTGWFEQLERNPSARRHSRGEQQGGGRFGPISWLIAKVKSAMALFNK